MEKPQHVSEVMPGFLGYLQNMWDKNPNNTLNVKAGMENFKNNQQANKEVAKKNLDSKKQCLNQF